MLFIRSRCSLVSMLGTEVGFLATAISGNNSVETG